MKIGIVGSRDFPEQQTVIDYIKTLTPDDTIMSGGAKGVDTWAIHAAQAQGLQTQEILPDLSQCVASYDYTKAYYARNQQIVDQVDMIVAFTQKDTGGTWDTIRRARKAGKDVQVIRPVHPKPKGDAKPHIIGAGPFHMRHVGLGSMALHLRKYFTSIQWADFLNLKAESPEQCWAYMLPDFAQFFQTYHPGGSFTLTQAPKNTKRQGIHPVDIVGQHLADTLHLPYIEMFAPWEKPHRGRCLHDQPPTIIGVSPHPVIYVLDDIATTHTTIRLSVQALRGQGYHAHGLVYVRY